MMLAAVLLLLLRSTCLPAAVKADKKVSNKLIIYNYNYLYVTLIDSSTQDMYNSTISSTNDPQLVE